MANPQTDTGRLIRQVALDTYKVQAATNPRLFYTVTIEPGGSATCNCYSGVRGECQEHTQLVLKKEGYQQ